MSTEASTTVQNSAEVDKLRKTVEDKMVAEQGEFPHAFQSRVLLLIGKVEYQSKVQNLQKLLEESERKQQETNSALAELQAANKGRVSNGEGLPCAVIGSHLKKLIVP